MDDPPSSSHDNIQRTWTFDENCSLKNLMKFGIFDEVQDDSTLWVNITTQFNRTPQDVQLQYGRILYDTNLLINLDLHPPKRPTPQDFALHSQYYLGCNLNPNHMSNNSNDNYYLPSMGNSPADSHSLHQKRLRINENAGTSLDGLSNPLYLSTHDKINSDNDNSNVNNVASSSKSGYKRENQEEKPGNQWTETERKLFLIGMEYYGFDTNDWKSIAMNFVKTKENKQVISYAQKFNNRQKEKREGRIHRKPSKHDEDRADDTSFVNLYKQGLITLDVLHRLRPHLYAKIQQLQENADVQQENR